MQLRIENIGLGFGSKPEGWWLEEQHQDIVVVLPHGLTPWSSDNWTTTETNCIYNVKQATGKQMFLKVAFTFATPGTQSAI